jgi:hypothetical protein
MVDDKIDDGKQSTSFAGHFYWHGSALVHYVAHCLMYHAQGFSGSHWMPPSGNNSLHIAPAASRGTINKTTMQNTPPLLAISMALDVRRYYTVHIA